MQLLQQLGQYLHSHTTSISIGLTATLVVVLGPHLNRMFRKHTASVNAFIRFPLFVLFCTFGYGFLSSQLAKWISHSLRKLNPTELALTVTISFILLALFSRKSGEI